MEITQSVTVDVITIKEGIWEIDLSTEEVQEIYNDVVFLRNAVLSLLNPTVANAADLPYNTDQYKQLLKDYFLKERDLNYNKEFLQSIFT